MKANIIKRMLCGALALSLVLAPGIGVSATERGTVAPVAEATAEEATTVAFPNVRETSTVAGIRSTVGGVFLLEKGINVATTTNLNTLAANYNLEAGARPYVKAYDMDTKKSNLAKASLDAAATAYGATSIGYINFELGAMNKGVYSLLEGGAGVDAAFSIPAASLQAGASYGVICVKEGGVVTVIKDTNPDDSIITVTLPAGRSAIALIKF
ncbi:MAG: hypothetical protein ACI4DN_04875 [Lachnospiraceae bacterium]